MGSGNSRKVILAYIGSDSEAIERIDREYKNLDEISCFYCKNLIDFGRTRFPEGNIVALIDVQYFENDVWEQIGKYSWFLKNVFVVWLIPQDMEEEALRRIYLVDDMVLKQGYYERRIGFTVRKLIERSKLENAKKKAEKTAYQNLKNLKKIVEYGPDGIFIVDAGNKVLVANQAAGKIVGKDVENLIGEKLWFDVKPGEIREIIINGQKRGTFAEVQAIEINWENLPAKLVHIRDITRYKVTQSKMEHFSRVLEALRRISQNTLLVDNVHEFLKRSVNILVENGGYICGLIIARTSEDTYTAFYRTFLEVDGRDFSITESELPQCTKIYQTEGPVCLINPSICKGCSFQCSSAEGPMIIGRLSSEEEHIGWVMCRMPDIPGLQYDGVEIFHEAIGDIVVGINSVKAKETASRLMSDLEQSEEKFRKAFDMSPVWLSITTLRNGKILDVNRSCLESLGFSKEEVIGKTVYDLGVYENIDDRDYVVHSLITGRNLKNCELSLKSKNGDSIDVQASAELITIGGEKCILCVMQDLRYRKQLEAELRQAQKMEAIGRLAGGVAHDFNNALAVIMGYAEMIKFQVNEESPFWKPINEIIDAIRRASDLTKKLLVFARKQVTNPQIIMVNDFIEHSLKMIRRLVGEDISVEFVPGENIKPVKIDPVLLDQVLMNLAVNARDAIRDSGRIVVETNAVFLDEAFCYLKPNVKPGDYVCIVFKDNGEGMSQEVMEHIFEPFFTTKGDKGTGLGLSTVYAIVTQHGGFIDVESELRKGTTFRIYLPVYAEEALDITSVEALDDIPLGIERILVVEDDKNLSRVLENLLSRCGYRVFTFHLPSLAIEYCQVTPKGIDLVLTDLVLPEMNGVQLKDKIKEIMPEARFLFMTGYSADVLEQKGIKVDNQHILMKPFDIRTLAHRVREILDAESEEGC